MNTEERFQKQVGKLLRFQIASEYVVVVTTR